MRVRVPPAEQKEKDMQLKVFTAFSGYDSQCMALDRLGIGYELVVWSEIECDVDEKYFLSEKMIKGFIRHNIAHVKKGTGFLWLPKTGDGTADCLRANGALNPTDNSIIVGEYSEPEIIQRSRGFNKGGTYTICPAITSNSWQENNFLCLEKIRRLTPRECFRLMGVSESDINKIQNAGISDSRQYVMAGNSIVVDVLFHIFRKLFTDKSCESIQKKLF